MLLLQNMVLIVLFHTVFLPLYSTIWCTVLYYFRFTILYNLLL